MLVSSFAVAAMLAPGAAAPAPASNEAIVQELNRVRIARGLVPLRVDATLQRAARAHSVDMLQNGYFAHGAFAERMQRYGAARWFVGENLAWAVSANAATFVRMWLRSPGHRANVLRPSFRRVGVAAVTGRFLGYRNATVVTADFAAP